MCVLATDTCQVAKSRSCRGSVWRLCENHRQLPGISGVGISTAITLIKLNQAICYMSWCEIRETQVDRTPYNS